MKKNIITLACSAAAVLACVSSTQATPGIRWSFDGGTTWSATVNDGGVGDTKAAVGQVGVDITLGGFTFSASGTGATKPLLGTAGSPIMDLGVDGAGSTGGGTLIVEFTETDYSPVPHGSYITGFGVNNLFSAGTMYTFIGANSQFAGAGFSGGLPTGPVISTIGPLSGNHSANGSGVFAGVQPNPYSITLAEVYTLPGSPTAPSGVSISGDGNLTVPDGGNTLMLLGSALSVLGLGVFRNSRKAVKA
jgi:hypothetical protein